jgi:hypothetical protein
MLLAYIDESSDKTTYFINTLLVQDSDVIPLGDSLHELRLEICGKYGLPEGIEFHGYDILNGNSDWLPIRSDYAAQKEIYNRIMDCIIQFDVRIYIKGINIAAFVSKYGNDETVMHNAALTWNLEKVQSRAKQENEIALVIADEVGAQSTFYRARLRFHQRIETFGWDPVVLDRIADTIHFAPSKESSLIQAIDILAHANIRARRRDKNPDLVAFQEGLHDKLWNSGRLRYYNIW